MLEYRDIEDHLWFRQHMRGNIVSYPKTRAFWSSTCLLITTSPPATAGYGSISSFSNAMAENFKIFMAHSTLNSPAESELSTIPEVLLKLGDIKFKCKCAKLNTKKIAL